MSIRTPRRPAATLSLTVLLLLPVLLLTTLFAWNVQMLDRHRAAQEAATDASVLAGGRALVDDRMLHGTPSNRDDLADLARTTARFYAQLNPLPDGLTLAFADEDFIIEESPHPFDSSLRILDALTLTGQRNLSASWGAKFFGSPQLPSGAVAKVVLDRRVAGLRSLFDKHVPLMPMALRLEAWEEHVEASAPPAPWTVTLKLPDAIFLNIGGVDGDGFVNQIANGIAPSHLGSGFMLDPAHGAQIPLLKAVDSQKLHEACHHLVGQQTPRIWPLYSTTDGAKGAVVRLVAARVVALAEGADGLALTLQPSCFASPSIVTDHARTPNPYLCRVRLSK